MASGSGFGNTKVYSASVLRAPSAIVSTVLAAHADEDGVEVVFVSNTAAAPAPDPQGLRFVARQPIFDRQRRLFGYELLFRDSWENNFGGKDADIACRSTLDSSLLMGLDLLCDNAVGFFNCTRETLMNDYNAEVTPKKKAA